MPKNRFTHYAVARGRKPGVYTDWSQTKQQIDGFSSAKYKGFHSALEAQQWIDQNSNVVLHHKEEAASDKEVESVNASTNKKSASRLATNQMLPKAGIRHPSDSGKRQPKDGASDADKTTGKTVIYIEKTGRPHDLAEEMTKLQISQPVTFKEALTTFRPGIYKGDVIKRLWSDLLQSWFERGAQVFIVSPWIDKKTLGYIKNRLMTSQSSIQTLYIRDPCFTDGTGNETSLAEAMRGVFSESEAERIRCLRVGTDREADGKAYFHCKFVAGNFDGHVEILMTSANFNEHHFNPLQRDSVILLSESCRDFETRYLDVLENVTKEVSLATLLK